MLKRTDDAPLLPIIIAFLIFIPIIFLYIFMMNNEENNNKYEIKQTRKIEYQKNNNKQFNDKEMLPKNNINNYEMNPFNPFENRLHPFSPLNPLRLDGPIFNIYGLW